MKRIEITVVLNAKVEDEVAQGIEKHPGTYFLNVPLSFVELMDGEDMIPAKFTGFETTNLEVCD